MTWQSRHPLFLSGRMYDQSLFLPTGSLHKIPIPQMVTLLHRLPIPSTNLCNLPVISLNGWEQDLPGQSPVDVFHVRPSFKMDIKLRPKPPIKRTKVAYIGKSNKIIQFPHFKIEFFTGTHGCPWCHTSFGGVFVSLNQVTSKSLDWKFPRHITMHSASKSPFAGSKPKYCSDQRPGRLAVKQW